MGGLDERRRLKAEANFFEVVLFSFLFNLINFHLLRIGVTTDAEKAEDQTIGIKDADELGIRTTDSEEADGAEANGAKVDGVDKSGIGIRDPAKADRADEKDISLADLLDSIEVNGTVEPSTGTADPVEANGVDKPEIGPANPVDPAKVNGADESGTSTRDRADKPDTGLVAKDPRRRSAERRVAARASFFSFRRIAYLFFSSLEERPLALG